MSHASNNTSGVSGPRTRGGKARSSRNATTHGLLSRDLFLKDERPEEFAALFDGLCAELRPYGTLELTLVERIAVAMWRQRRLLRAERAAIELKRGASSFHDHRRLADQAGVSADDPRVAQALEGASVLSEHGRAALAEIDAATTWPADEAALAATMPALHQYLQIWMMRHEVASVAELMQRRKLTTWRALLEDIWAKLASDARVDEVAGLLRDAAAIPQHNETLSRYQSALDNELYKATRALREAQSFRLRTMDSVGQTEASEGG